MSLKKNGFSVRRATETVKGPQWTMRYVDFIGQIQTVPLEGADSRAEARQMAQAKYLRVMEQTDDKARENRFERKDRLARLAAEAVGQRYKVGEAITKWELEQHASQALAPLYIAKRVQILRRWATDMGLLHKLPSELEVKDVSQWINGVALDRKVHTRRVFMSHLQNFCDWLHHSGLSFTNPARQIGKIAVRGLPHTLREKRTHHIYTDREIKLFCVAADAVIAEEVEATKLHPLYGLAGAENTVNRGVALCRFVKSAFLISVNLGLRISDICDLQHIQFSPGFLTVWTHKRDKRVKLPINATVQKIFGDCVDSCDPLWMFPEAHEEHVSQLNARHPSPYWRDKYFRRICARAGITSNVVFHDCRATAIYRWKQAGVTMPHIAQLVGHSDTRTTEDYISGASMGVEEIVYDEQSDRESETETEAEVAANLN